MRRPAPLRPGDAIALAATARFAEPAHIKAAADAIRTRGYTVVEPANLRSRSGVFAGTDAERRDGFQHLLDDPSVRAIWCVRGGYGTMRMLEGLDWSRFREDPSWLIGYSDVTALHAAVNGSLDVETLHATMGVNLSHTTLQAVDSLFDALAGRAVEISAPPHADQRSGTATGTLVGGNLSMVHTLLGTPWAVQTRGAILFIEEVDEYLYHVDRMLLALRLGGALDEIRALVVGGMTHMHDNDDPPFGQTLEDIVRCHVPDNVPIAVGVPVGHVDDHRALRLGAMTELTVQASGVRLVQP